MDTDDPAIIRRFELAQDRSVLQASDLSLETIAQMVDSDAIDIQPQYQRRARWSAAKRSALIESFLLNIPVPPVYLAEDDYGTYSVIDGKQRIAAVHEFMRDDFALTKLDDFEELKGRRFSGLPTPLHNALKVRPYIRAITLLRQSDPELKYEVFQRLNTGGEPLNAQEIRNSAYRGPLNDLVYELAKAPFLREQLRIRDDKAASYRTMLDAEFVLRFLTLSDSWATFSGDFRISMDRYMAANQRPSASGLQRMRSDFEKSLDWCRRLWGGSAFQRPLGSGWQNQALAGMYDAEMVAVSTLSDAKLERIDPAKLLAETRNQFDDQEFENAVRVATNTPSRITYRISVVRDVLAGLAS